MNGSAPYYSCFNWLHHFNGKLFCILWSSSELPEGDIPLGIVSFKDNSTKLTKEAKTKLDMMIVQIRHNRNKQVRLVTSFKDLCDECGKRSWDRTDVIFRYLENHGLRGIRPQFNTFWAEESNNVELILTEPIEYNPQPHPNLRKSHWSVETSQAL